MSLARIEVILKRFYGARVADAAVSYPSETAERSPEGLDTAGLIDWLETTLALALRAEPNAISIALNDPPMVDVVDVPTDTEPTRDGMAFYLAMVEDALRSAR